MGSQLGSLFGIARRGVHPREVGVAVWLGVLAGFVSGWNLSLAAVLLAVMLLRAPLKMFAQAWAIAAAAAWALTPLTFHTGYFLLESSPVRDWIAPPSGGVWVALFDLDRYTLIGGLAWAPLLGLPCAWSVGRVTGWLQTQFLALSNKVEQHQAWQMRAWMRVACWMLFGGIRRARQPAPYPRWLRTSGLLLGALVVLPVTGLAWFYAPHYVEQAVLRGLSAANGAEVTAGRIEISLSGGQLNIERLQIPDAEDLHRDKLRIGHVAAVVSPGPLLRGRVEVQRIILEDLEDNVPRKHPARRYRAGVPDFGGHETEDNGSDAADGNLAEYSADGNAGEESWKFALDDYTQDWGAIEQRINKLRAVVDQVEQLAKEHRGRGPRTGPPSLKQGIPLAYRAMRNMRCVLNGHQPAIIAHRVLVKNVTPDWGLGAGAKIELANVSSDPPKTGQPTRLTIDIPRRGVNVAARLNFHQPGRPHGVTFSARDVRLNQLVNVAKLSDKFEIRDGKFSLKGNGTFTRDRLDLPLTVDCTELDVDLVGYDKVAGLSPDLWNQGLSKLRGIRLDAAMYGRLHSPRMRLDGKELVDAFRRQLQQAGQVVLATAVDEQIRYGKQIVTEKAEEVMEDVAGGVAVVEDAIHQQQAKVDAAVASGRSEIANARRMAEEKAAQTQRRIARSQTKTESALNNARSQVEQALDAAGQLANRAKPQPASAAVNAGNTRTPETASIPGGNALGGLARGLTGGASLTDVAPSSRATPQHDSRQAGPQTNAQPGAPVSSQPGAFSAPQESRPASPGASGGSALGGPYTIVQPARRPAAAVAPGPGYQLEAAASHAAGQPATPAEDASQHPAGGSPGSGYRYPTSPPDSAELAPGAVVYPSTTETTGGASDRYPNTTPSTRSTAPAGNATSNSSAIYPSTNYPSTNYPSTNYPSTNDAPTNNSGGGYQITADSDAPSAVPAPNYPQTRSSDPSTSGNYPQIEGGASSAGDRYATTQEHYPRTNGDITAPVNRYPSTDGRHPHTNAPGRGSATPVPTGVTAPPASNFHPGSPPAARAPITQPPYPSAGVNPRGPNGVNGAAPYGGPAFPGSPQPYGNRFGQSNGAENRSAGASSNRGYQLYSAEEENAQATHGGRGGPGNPAVARNANRGPNTGLFGNGPFANRPPAAQPASPTGVVPPHVRTAQLNNQRPPQSVHGLPSRGAAGPPVPRVGAIPPGAQAQPPLAPGQSPPTASDDDSWQVAEWADKAGRGITDLIFGEVKKPAPQPQMTPQQIQMQQQILQQQMRNLQMQQQMMQQQPISRQGTRPPPMAGQPLPPNQRQPFAQPVPRTAAGPQPAGPQAGAPWYKFW